MGRKNPWYHPNCADSGAALLPVTRETPRLFDAGLGAGFGTASAGTSHHRFPLFGGLHALSCPSAPFSMIQNTCLV